jgi:hypothetical protein
VLNLRSGDSRAVGLKVGEPPSPNKEYYERRT